MEKKMLEKILQNHKLWLNNNGGEKANMRWADLRKADLRKADLRKADLREADLRKADLREANLYEADLRGANLREANLCRANMRWANLRGADLRWADLRWADLRGANMRKADLREADLRGADLRWADLREADLRWADLRKANLYEANLRGANMRWADLPDFQIIPQCGEFIGWKKGGNDEIIKLKIPAWARRTSCLKNRKCRTEFVIVLEITKNNKQLTECRGSYNSDIIYRVGKCITPDSYDPDIHVDCTNGIHFFITRKEAEEY